MDNTQSNHQLTSNDIYDEVARIVVAYMVDCGLKDADVIAGYPGWTSVALRRDETAQDVLRNVNALLERNAFDEANAEKLMALPALRRPATPEEAMEYLCERFVNEGLGSELKFAQWIGLDCGEQALEMMRGFEQAAAGTEYTSPSARFARLVRDQCIAKRQATAHAEA